MAAGQWKPDGRVIEICAQPVVCAVAVVTSYGESAADMTRVGR